MAGVTKVILPPPPLHVPGLSYRPGRFATNFAQGVLRMYANQVRLSTSFI